MGEKGKINIYQYIIYLVGKVSAESKKAACLGGLVKSWALQLGRVHHVWSYYGCVVQSLGLSVC